MRIKDPQVAMPKNALLLIVFSVIVLTALATLLFNFRRPATLRSEIETAVNQAKFLYSQRKGAGEDFSSGPCLTNALLPGWVVDIAHSPRLPIDDLPENQCASYREGRADHFVELDPEGNLIRVK